MFSSQCNFSPIKALEFRVIIHAYSLLPQTYLRSSLTRYLGTDHLVFVGGRGVGLGTYQKKVLNKKFKRKKKFMHKKVPEKRIQASVLAGFVYEQVFKNTRKNISPLSGESGADIYNHPPKIAQINLQ